MEGGGPLIDFAYRFEIADFVERLRAIDFLIDFGDVNLCYRFAYRFWIYDSAL